MLDIPALSAIISATSVTAGVFFAVLSLRNLVRQRQTEFLYELQSVLINEEYRRAWAKIRDSTLVDYEDCVQTCEYEFELVIAFYETLGILLKRKLIDPQLLTDIFGASILRVWNRSKLYVSGARNDVQDSTLYWGFEYLYNAIQENVQKPSAIQ
jgi:hypothetical protein